MSGRRQRRGQAARGRGRAMAERVSRGAARFARGRGREARGGDQEYQNEVASVQSVVVDATAVRVSEEWILSTGLALVGFNPKRQQVRAALNVERFRAFYGVSPKAIAEVHKDLIEQMGTLDTKYFSCPSVG